MACVKLHARNTSIKDEFIEVISFSRRKLCQCVICLLRGFYPSYTSELNFHQEAMIEFECLSFTVDKVCLFRSDHEG